MIWPAYISLSSPSPSEVLTLSEDEIDEPLTLIGASMFGWVYRSTKPLHWYRLIPRDRVPLKQRSELRAWAERSAALGLVQVIHTQVLASIPYFLIGYRTATPADSFEEALKESPPLQDLEIVLNMIRLMEGWRAAVGGSVLPMPADILIAQGRPLLLGLPYVRLPQINDVFEAPERALYLAPEVLRGSSGGEDDALDRYAIGVFLLRCFRALPALPSADQVLLGAMTNRLFTTGAGESVLLPWMNRIRVTQLALARIQSLLTPEPATRYPASWAILAQELESCRRGMEPHTAVNEMRMTQGGESAFSLLQDILLTEETYELLLLGGTIAGADLKRPLAALEMLERAVMLAPPEKRADVYREHFRLIIGLINHPALALLCKSNPQVATQIDTTVERDVDALSGTNDTVTEDWVDYLLWRGQCQRAVDVIHPQLFERNTFAFWKLRSNVQYIEALICLRQVDTAYDHLKSVRERLTGLLQNRTVPAEEVHRWGIRIAELERLLLNLRKSPT